MESWRTINTGTGPRIGRVKDESYGTFESEWRRQERHYPCLYSACADRPSVMGLSLANEQARHGYCN